jgi:YihY family inner membrane protein
MRSGSLSTDEASRDVAGTNAPERLARRLDRFQQRHVAVAFPVAVLKKYGEDNAGSLAALLSYYGFFSLFPLLAVATTILGHVLAGNPTLRQQLLDTALRNVPLIGSRIATDVHALDASGVALAIAIVLTIWSGLGAVKAFEYAMNTIWNVPHRRRPGFVPTNLRALAMLVGLAALILVSSLTAMSGLFGQGLVGATAGFLVSVVVHTALFLGAYTVLSAAPVGWRTNLPGAIVAAIAWTVLLRLGGVFVAHEIASANEVYGTFALVVGLLAWLYLGSSVALYAAEINVVRAGHLWPRSVIQPPITDADERMLVRYARESERRPEVQVDVHTEARQP